MNMFSIPKLIHSSGRANNGALDELVYIAFFFSLYKYVHNTNKVFCSFRPSRYCALDICYLKGNWSLMVFLSRKMPRNNVNQFSGRWLDASRNIIPTRNLYRRSNWDDATSIH